MVASTIVPQQTTAETAFGLATPESVGFAADLPKRFETLLASGRWQNVHGIVALRKGRIVFERYFTGTDEVWGRPLGTVEFKADTLHDMRSVTKSIVGLLYGIALGQGHVPAPDQSLLAQFPEYPELISAGRAQGSPDDCSCFDDDPCPGVERRRSMGKHSDGSCNGESAGSLSLHP